MVAQLTVGQKMLNVLLIKYEHKTLAIPVTGYLYTVVEETQERCLQSMKYDYKKMITQKRKKFSKYWRDLPSTSPMRCAMTKLNLMQFYKK